MTVKRLSMAFAIAVAAVIAVSLSGCASSLAQVNTWSGNPAAASEAAVLKTPKAIQVLRVNGQGMTNYLLDDLALDYGLLPGQNVVVFDYKSIWAKSGVVENGESKVHVVQSKPQVVRFDARPNQAYRFEFEAPKSRAEAMAVADDFRVSIIDADGKVVARSEPWNEAEARQAAMASSAPQGGSDRAAGAMASGSTLEQMKALWSSASEEEKRAFMSWALK
ncbi:DUF2057 family protein [Marinobacter sp. C2H3]|uniref:DUF2057 family protein n=1 Tax=Marinobacter sp. C2H3 TaxID=3119003 RepID=UPI00300F29B1